MTTKKEFDVIIIGGSYAGLSAALALGRSKRDVLIVNGGNPRNKKVHHAHNLLTHDGEPPEKIFQKAKREVLKYPTVKYLKGIVTKTTKKDHEFQVTLKSGKSFTAKKILFTTGLKDLLPEIEGFQECWGVSIAHCPYCHAYELKGKKTAIFGNNEPGFLLAMTVRHWQDNLTLFTNGKAELSPERLKILKKHQIKINEQKIKSLEHKNGQIKKLHLTNGEKHPLDYLFASVISTQKNELPLQLGCEIDEQNRLHIDANMKTTTYGVYAAGDSASPGRSLSGAIATGTTAGICINNDLIQESYEN